MASTPGRQALRTPRTSSGKRGAPRLPISPEAIYDRIVSAIVEHRLTPGTKLGEDRLAEIFAVNRSRIRAVLARLAHEQIVRLEPNRGAFVAAPTVADAREIFDSRRLIEPGIVQRLVETVDRDGMKQLRALVREEAQARRNSDRHAVIRLSGEFHLRMAQLAGNRFLAKAMRELTSLTCLIIFLYDSPTLPSCHGDEHDTIVEAIGRKDAPGAVRLMLEHLNHVEASLALHEEHARVLDLDQVFA